MEPRAYLAELGYSNEDIAAMLADEKQAKLISAAAKSYGEGKALKTQAETERAETNTFWETKTRELQGSVDKLTKAEKRAATAEAASASRAAYLKSLADQGYDVPKDMYEGAPAVNPNDPARDPGSGKYVTEEDFNKRVRATAPDLVTLTAISNEYLYLFGKPYTSINEDFKEAQAAGKSLSEYARSKHKFSEKQAEKDQAAAEESYQTRYKADLAKEQAKWAETHGSNPETRTPVPSRFDKLQKQPGFEKDSWKTPKGREANREARLKRFENLPLQ